VPRCACSHAAGQLAPLCLEAPTTSSAMSPMLLHCSTRSRKPSSPFSPPVARHCCRRQDPTPSARVHATPTPSLSSPASSVRAASANSGLAGAPSSQPAPPKEAGEPPCGLQPPIRPGLAPHRRPVTSPVPARATLQGFRSSQGVFANQGSFREV
jgi:hypothetical protein